MRKIDGKDYPIIQAEFLPPIDTDGAACYDCGCSLTELQADVSYVRFHMYLCEDDLQTRKRKR